MFFLFVGTSWAVENPFRSEVQVSPIENSKGNMEIIVSVPDGFHLYRDMMQITPVSPKGLAYEKEQFPKGIFLADPANPQNFREQFNETVRINIPL